MEKRESNYEIMKHRMQEEFAACDMDAICREWELKQEGDKIQVTFVGRTYLLDQSSGAVYLSGEDGICEADFNVSMTLYDILTRPRKTASGEMVSIGALTALRSTSVPGGDLFVQTAKRFEHKTELLSAVCSRLGGIPYGRGDASYLLPVFRDVYVTLIFWDADEEFDSKITFLCDGKILEFMHYETVFYLLCHIADRIMELAESLEK